MVSLAAALFEKSFEVFPWTWRLGQFVRFVNFLLLETMSALALGRGALFAREFERLDSPFHNTNIRKKSLSVAEKTNLRQT